MQHLPRFAISASRSLILVLAFVFGVAARSRDVVHLPAPAIPPTDIFSAASAEVRTEHLSLDLTLDFPTQTLHGTATHQLANVRGARSFVVDTRDLDIHSVTIDGQTATYTLGPVTANGQILTVDIVPTTRVVSFDYSTRATSGALHWLTAKQTRGRVMPFLWVQGEPDNARSWIPVQDTPAARMTWDATLHVPSGMLALMSAPNSPTLNESGIYHFEMRHSVPPYLIVFAAGRLAGRPLGDRTAIYAEPELIDDAAYEMQFLPQMLTAAERVIATYPWERYDLLFPPAFGGGMENPDLNFIAPDVISGNHPVPVIPHGIIAHEMAHSWFGDMMTCATWSDTWLNEGFATYFEKRIVEEMAGTERSEAGFFTDRRAYENYLTAVTPPDRLQIIHRDFAGTERPGNAFNIIAYQKGELFLKMLEDRLGRGAFDSMIDRYLELDAFHWVDDHAFLSALRPTLIAEPAGVAESLNIAEWLYGPGLPKNATAPTSSRVWDRVAVQGTAFRNGKKVSQLDRSGWTVLEENIFLQVISDIIPSRLQDLEEGFGFSRQNTPPILWLLGVARKLDTRYLPVLERYLMRGTSGSLPIWSELGNSAAGRTYGRGVYQRSREFYDPNSQRYIDQVLNLHPANKTDSAPQRASDGLLEGGLIARPPDRTH